MVDLTQSPTTTADLSHGATPQEFERRGVEPALAAQLAAEHNKITGRAPPPAKLPPPMNPTDAAGEATDDMAAHFESLYAPPSTPQDYRIPAPVGPVTDEAAAADRALTRILHAEALPVDIGNAMLMDLAGTRTIPKSAESVNALRPWVQQLLRTAQTTPELATYARALSPEMLIERLSPETVVALLPFASYRATRRT